MKIDPNNPKALFRKAKVLMISSQVDAASEIVQKYLTGDTKADEAAFKKLSDEI